MPPDDPVEPPPRVPPRIRPRSRVLLEGPDEAVICLCVSPDGQILAAGDASGTVRLWTLPGGKLLRSLKGHTARVTGLGFTPGGLTLVSSSIDQSLRFWDPQTGAERREPERGRNIRGKPFVDMRSSPDGRALALAQADAGFWVAELSPSNQLPNWLHTRRAGFFTRVAFSPDGKRCAGLAYNQGVEVVDTALVEGRYQLLAFLYEGGFNCLAFSPDSATLALGGISGKLKLWRPPESATTPLMEQPGPVLCLAWTPDGGTLVLGGSEGGHLHTWHLAKREHEQVREGRCKGMIQAVTFAEGGRTLITAHGGAAVGVQLWDVEELPP
jgi:WD40 repeat protein